MADRRQFLHNMVLSTGAYALSGLYVDSHKSSLPANEKEELKDFSQFAKEEDFGPILPNLILSVQIL